tara:strand:- start:5902 stop:6552 length:651 start_codon:yes stop_codon:yes gene_type:complete
MKKSVNSGSNRVSDNDEYHKYNKLILWITLFLLVLFEIYSVTTDSHYKWDFFFLVAMMVGVYVVKDKIKLHPFHFTLLGVFLILHNLGTFGTYRNFYYGLEFDFYVHTYFGFVSALMLYRTYNLIGPYRQKWFMFIAIVAVVLGMSAFHELFEYAGAMTVGEGEGVLFIGAGDIDEWDTQKDMRNNLIGGILALSFYFIYNKFPFNKKSQQNLNNI